MFVHRRALARPCGSFVGFVLVRVQLTAFEERDLFVEDGVVAGCADVRQRREDEPETIVGDPGAHALSAGLVPPMLNVPFDELPGCRVQKVCACGVRRGEEQRQHVLQLIAETERTAGLVEGRAAPDAT